MKDICTERHENISDRFYKNEKDIQEHDKRLDELEVFKAGADIRMEHLIKEISCLVIKLDKFIAIITTTAITLGLIPIGFFIWYIQQL